MNDTIYVIETDDDIYLGRIEFLPGKVVVRSGFVGRPQEVLAEDIVRLYPAEMHPAVVVVDYIQAI